MSYHGLSRNSYLLGVQEIIAEKGGRYRKAINDIKEY